MKEVTRGAMPIAAIVFILLAGIAGVYFFASARGGGRESAVESVEKTIPFPANSAVNEKEVMTQSNGQYAGALLAGSAATLLDFTKADYEKAKTADTLVVLYFYANWCPICKQETVNALYPAFNELTDARVIGFRVSYNDSDTDSDEKELAREFGVGYQHTKVFLKNNQRVLKSPEGWDKERYLAEIVKATQ